MRTLTFDDSRLIIGDHWGIYIPQRFCDGMDATDADRINVDILDVQVCQSGPDHPYYWDVWQSILDSAEITDRNGQRWGLYQNGDLFEYPIGCDIPEW
jgi:hypothetical protein